jgi:Adenylate and Guanylate cyclase catalytic domain
MPHFHLSLTDVSHFIVLPLDDNRSSCREPIAIFQFLEDLYQNFDRLAGQHGIFKVETVRDSYGGLLLACFVAELNGAKVGLTTF